MSWIDKKEIKIEEVDVDYIITQYNGDLRNNAIDFVKLEIVEKQDIDAEIKHEDCAMDIASYIKKLN